MSAQNTRKVVPILLAAVAIEFCLGSAFGWSLFTKSLMDYGGWTRSQVTLTYSLYVFFNGAIYLLIGYWADHHPRTIASAGGLLFGLGIFVAGFSAEQRWLYPMYLGYGLLAGCGISLPYMAVLSVAIKWLPHRRGLASGLVLMGMGMGAVLMGLLVPDLLKRWTAGQILMGMGVVFTLVCGTLGLVMTNPPGQKLPDRQPRIIPWEVFRSGRFWGLWGIMAVMMGSTLAVFSQAAVMAQELHRVSLAVAGTLVALMAVCNGSGRILWPSISDGMGRRKVLVTLMLTQAAAFLAAVHLGPVWAFEGALCYIAFCYGGLCGTMPAFTADLFGADKVGKMYGPIISAQALAGLASPLIYSALRDGTGSYSLPTHLSAGALVLAAVLPVIIARPDPCRSTGREAESERLVVRE